MKAKKSLGQIFLINKDKIRKIVANLDLQKNDLVIEVGPGHGELTEEIRNERLDIRIIAIEKDKELAVDLKNKFKNCKNIEIIEGDALKILADLINNLPASPKLQRGEPASLKLPLRSRDSEASQRGERQTTNNYKIVGNIPYYITGYLLRIIGELKNKPTLAVLTIQKEVAERICAKPPKMNLFAASVQFWAEPKIIDYISRKDFRPAPEVDSAIIVLRPRTNVNLTAPLAGQARIDADRYYKFIKILFKQPRKTILNNLRPITDNQQLLTAQLQKLEISLNNRSQDLSVEQIIVLSRAFK